MPATADENPPPFPFPLVAVRGDKVEKEWLRMVQEAAPGHVPVILGDRDDIQWLRSSWHMRYSLELEYAVADTLDVGKWLAAWRERHREEMEGHWWKESYPYYSRGIYRLSAGYTMLGERRPRVYIATIPLDDPSDVFVRLRYGNWNACPAPHLHTAFALRWQRLYGARIAAIHGRMIEFTVERRPVGRKAAWNLAWEHHAYCQDLLAQGYETIGTLAKSLRHSTRWYFYWE